MDAEQTFVPSGKIVAENVSAEDYMERYAAHNHEWVKGYVIAMSPSTTDHKRIIGYLYQIFLTYLSLRPIGEVFTGENFVMRLDAVESRREPDIIVMLGETQERLKKTYLDGPADICIEVVSSESSKRDYGEKFTEYEAGGVPEYWIIDPMRQETRFHRLSDAGTYRQVIPSEDVYTTPLLPDLRLPIPVLWREQLPSLLEVVEQMRADLKTSS